MREYEDEEVDDGADSGEELAPDSGGGDESSGGGLGKKALDKGADMAKDKMKDKAKEKLAKDAAKKVAAKGSLGAALGPIMFWAGIVILALIIIIGIIMFFVTMPGMVMEKLKGIFKEIGSTLAAFFGADTTKQIDSIQIFETLDYLEEMGYDLKGFGYLTGYYEDLEHFTDEEKEKLVEAFRNENETPDVEERNNIKKYEDVKDKIELDSKNQGVVRSKKTGNIVLAKADYIFSYIASDNYVYTLKNDNLATQANTEGFWETLWSGIATAVYKYTYLFYGPIYDLFGLTDVIGETWGKGLIALYYEGKDKDGNGLLGVEGTFVNTNSVWNWDNMKINLDTKQLVIGRNVLFNSNNPLVFNLDGWTGRYGMPIEFLLSVHTSTMMPDLAYDMTNSFATEISLYLRDASGDVKSYYLNRDGSKVYYDDINIAINGCSDESWWGSIWSWIDNLHIDEKEYRALLKIGVEHASDDCDCETKKITIYRDPIGNVYVPSTEEGKDGIYTVVINKWIDLDVHYDKDTNQHYVLDENGEKKYLTDDEAKEMKKEYLELSLKAVKAIPGIKEEQLDGEEYEKICDECKKHLRAIIDLADQADDSNYLAYLPYIANVKNHWFRDVYFVVNESQFADLHAVEMDYQYEAVMKERWTLYEVDENQNIKLYITDDNGEFANKDYVNEYKAKLDEKLNNITDENEKEALKEKHDEIKSKIIEDTAKFPGLFYYADSREAAVEAELMVAKKAVELNMNDAGELANLGWSETSTGSGIWTAYEAKKGKTSYTSEAEPAFSKETREKEEDPVKQMIMGKILTEVYFETGNIAQTGEGIRTVTNADIKKMFLANSYFRYDGNQETAEAITELRGFIANEIKDTYGMKHMAYGPLNEQIIKSDGTTEDFSNAIYDKDGNRILSVVTEEDGSISIDYGSGKDVLTADEIKEKGVKYVKDYSGQVTLNQDSLNAFSMLENTHTLDADYIYRDFKELVVELGYFEKEELTDETPRLLQWIVPDTGSDGYPKRSIDKKENEPGSMIHSEGDIDANAVNTMVSAVVADANADAKKQTTSIKDKIQRGGGGGVMYTAVKSNITDGINTNNPFALDILEIGASPAKGNEVLAKYKAKEHGIKDPILSTITVTQLLSAARGICTEMDDLGYDYCVCRLTSECTSAKCGTPGCPNDDTCPCPGCQEPICNHVFNHSCGLSSTFEASKSSPDNQNVCCNQLVSWVLQEVGLFDEGQVEGIASTADIALELGGTIIDNFDDLKPGDIMFYIRKGKYRLSHIDILGEKESDSSFLKYNGGHYASVGNGVPDNSSIDTFDRSSFDKSINELVFGIRLFGDPEPGIYEGYHGNEAVVSPVTGILLEYGTYEPDITTGTHIDSITGEEYRVNVDLKYGPLTGYVYKDKASLLTGGEKYEPKIVSDKVGYAKILVLDTLQYQRLERTTPNSWQSAENSLVEKDGTYREELVSEDGVKAVDRLKMWSDLDKLVYGYKEFAECYERFGIAGYTIYIDGFVCEQPDPDIPIEDAKDKLPKGDEIEFDDFKEAVTPSKFNNVNNYSGTPMPTKYEPDKEYKMASQSATEKLAGEIQVKAAAFSTMCIETEKLNTDGTIQYTQSGGTTMEDVCFIKEGTILGRTMTDKELIEDRIEEYQSGKTPSHEPEPQTYEELRPSMLKKYETFDQVIGNYVRIIMRDLAGTPVENVEDYMKLDKVEIDLDWELFYWLPFESRRPRFRRLWT